MTTIPKLNQGDILEMKKPHPCGGTRMRILRLGSDVKIECLACAHQMTLNRIKLEKSIRRILASESEMKGNAQ